MIKHQVRHVSDSEGLRDALLSSRRRLSPFYSIFKYKHFYYATQVVVNNRSVKYLRTLVDRIIHGSS